MPISHMIVMAAVETTFLALWWLVVVVVVEDDDDVVEAESDGIDIFSKNCFLVCLNKSTLNFA